MSQQEAGLDSIFEFFVKTQISTCTGKDSALRRGNLYTQIVFYCTASNHTLQCVKPSESQVSSYLDLHLVSLQAIEQKNTQNLQMVEYISL